MASKRDLKKDIRSITEQVIADALEMTSNLEKDADREKILEIILEITQIHNELIERVNHPDGKDNPKMIKKHFNAIIDDLMKGYSDAYEKLGKIMS
ncbi:MAG TPA: hypothetical protein VJY41_13040 [Prolixibacteraceae bacterium]|nr:hypothetical protein [Prolixibacteraceae bacterium]